jgi:hypothetical protein
MTKEEFLEAFITIDLLFEVIINRMFENGGITIKPVDYGLWRLIHFEEVLYEGEKIDCLRYYINNYYGIK